MGGEPCAAAASEACAAAAETTACTVGRYLELRCVQLDVGQRAPAHRHQPHPPRHGQPHPARAPGAASGRRAGLMQAQRWCSGEPRLFAAQPAARSCQHRGQRAESAAPMRTEATGHTWCRGALWAETQAGRPHSQVGVEQIENFHQQLLQQQHARPAPAQTAPQCVKRAVLRQAVLRCSGVHGIGSWNSIPPARWRQQEPSAAALTLPQSPQTAARQSRAPRSTAHGCRPRSAVESKEAGTAGV